MRSDQFEERAAQFVAYVARSVPEALKSVLFASPLSTRSTDLCLLWHSGYRQNHKFSLMGKLIGSLVLGAVKGFLRALGFRREGYRVYGEIGSSVLVVPSNCGMRLGDDQFATSYVHSAKTDCMYVFGELGGLGPQARKFELALWQDTIKTLCWFIWSGGRALWKVKVNGLERLLLGLKWMSWILSLDWTRYYGLEKTLSRLVEERRITKIGCIHEMHPYSRIVWRIARKFNARGYSVQHASISYGKRWYFPHQDEQQSGLALPDVFYSFDEGVTEMLRTSYAETQFIPGCSCRYARWVEVEPAKPRSSGYLLFVTALPSYDNEVVLRGASRILSDETPLVRIRVRLHPAAQVGLSLRSWLRAETRRGLIDISNGTSLQEDIEGAAAVIGMGSTSLQEALVMGRPVVQLLHPEYLHYVDLEGIRGALRIDHREFSADILESLLSQQVDTKEARKRLGLSNPLVTYDRLFAAECPSLAS